MNRLIISAVLVLVAANVTSGHHEEKSMPAMDEQAAMQAMMAAATPGQPHAGLAAMAGDFTAVMQMYMGPGEPMSNEMTVKREMDLDGRVLVERWEGNVMGQPFKGLGRTGYDNVTNTFWSTWTDNMSTGVILFKGVADQATKTITMTGTSTHPVTGQPYKMRSVATHNDDGTESMTMYEDLGQGETKSMSFVLTPM
ncbi:MAG: DUF1579 family protein [Pseudomonadota bacterium]